MSLVGGMKMGFINPKSSFGFTLAEVLIVIGIIGIVANLTIPALVKDTQNREIVSKLKETYSILSQAHSSIMQDEGGDVRSLFSSSSGAQYFDALITKLRVAKNCGTSAGCFTNEWYTDASRRYVIGRVGGDVSWTYKAILADGASIEVQGVWSNCSAQNFCGVIYIDVNGLKKPNSFGRDLFGFMIGTEKIVPMGSREDILYPNLASTGKCTSSSYGYGVACTASVLLEGNMDYLNTADGSAY